MEIPERLMIFGREYDVVEVRPSQLAGDAIAQASYRDGVIYVDESVDPVLKLGELWKGVLRAARQDLYGSSDDAQTQWIAVFVHQFLAHNPEIAESYLLGLNDVDLFEDDDDDDEGTDSELKSD